MNGQMNKLSIDCVTASSVIMLKTRLTHISGGRVTHKLNNVGLSISQRLPCQLAIWIFASGGNLVKFVSIRRCGVS